MPAALGTGEASRQQGSGPTHEAREAALRNRIAWDDSLLAHVHELWLHRDLLYMVTGREVKVRYKQTALGALWAILQPLSLMLIFTLFFSLFIGMPSDGLPYPLFSYAALLPWTFFSTALLFATPSLITNSQIITRIYFPREIIPMASVLAAMVDFAIAAVVFAGMLIVYGVRPTWQLLYVPPVLAIQFVFTTGVALFLSAVTVLYRDVRFTLPLVIQLWMFATPILYPLSIVPESIRVFYLTLNPMAVIVDSYRRAIVQGLSPEPLHLVTAAVSSLALLWLAYTLFKRLEREFADIV